MLLMLTGAVASAQTPARVPPALFDYALGMSAEAHTNQAKTPSGSAELAVSPFARFLFEYHSPRIDFTAGGSTEYVTHVGGTLKDEFQNKLNATGEVRLIEDRVHWRVRNDLDLFSVDPLGAQNDDNLQQLNVFSTGPDLYISNAPQAEVILRGRFLDFQSEAVDADNQQQRAELEIGRQFTPWRRGAVVLGQTEVEFENQALRDDFVRKDAALQIEEIRRSDGPTDEFTILAGRTEIEFNDDPGRAPVDAPLVQVQWRRNWLEKQAIRISARSELSDISREVQFASAFGIGQAALSIAVTRDPFEHKRYEAGGYRKWAGQDVRVNLYYDDIEYVEVEGFDQNHVGILGEWRRSLFPAIDFRGVAEIGHRRFDEENQRDDIVFLQGGIEYFRARHWTYGANVGWYDRNSNIPDLTGDDLFVSVTATYSR